MAEQLYNPDSEVVEFRVPISLVRTVIDYLEYGLRYSARPGTYPLPAGLGRNVEGEKIENFITSLKKIVEGSGDGDY